MSDLRSPLRSLLVLAAGLLALCLARAQAPELDATLNESVTMVPKKGMLFTTEIETTLYKPEGEGRFPIVLINHGKAAGDPRFQSRYRPGVAARFFLQRGYAVVVPMRQGFSRSTGSYIGGGCNVESNGRVQAEDVRAVLDWVAAQPWADPDRVLVVGQSHGGWTTLAFGAENYRGVRGLLNFAGGLRQDGCVAWQRTLVASVEGYAQQTRVPSLWFYGENDSYFNPSVSAPMFERYVAAGGKARLVAFGPFGSDAHALFGARAGLAIWQPEVTAFLASIGLPSEVQPQYARAGGRPAMPVPPRTTFAAFDDADKVPFLRDTGRAGYRAFLAKSMPRAFAIAPNGSWAWADGGDDPLRRALDNCSRNAKGDCRLYAVDEDVVWTADAP